MAVAIGAVVVAKSKAGIAAGAGVIPPSDPWDPWDPVVGLGVATGPTSELGEVWDSCDPEVGPGVAIISISVDMVVLVSVMPGGGMSPGGGTPM